MADRPQRIVIIDDVVSIRATLRVFLDATPGLEVVAEADNAVDGSRVVAATRPDLIVLDLNLGEGMSGQELLPLLRQDCPAARIVVLSAYADSAIRDEVLALGADAFVPKEDIGQVVQSVRALAGVVERDSSGPEKPL
jgi:DNA-binding NarL/FixJ family response regulator